MASLTNARNARLFESGRFSDMAIMCGERSWKVHKNVVLEQSRTLERMLEGSFQMRDTEARENRVDLSHDDESAVAAMLQYFYHADYDDQMSNVLHHDPLLFHVRVYIIAEKYFVESLGELALKKFKDAVPTAWYKDVFADVLAEVYSSTSSVNDAFRKTFVAIGMAGADYLLGEGGRFSPRAPNDKFQTVALATPAYMLELVRAQARRLLLQPHGPYSAELDDYNYWRGCLAAPPDPMMPDPGNAPVATELEEPEERTYRCPDCGASFRQRLWNYEQFTHPCSSTPYRVSPHYSGRQWLEYVVT